MLEPLVDQVLNRSRRLLLRNLCDRRRNHVGFSQDRVLIASAQRVLHQQLLQLQIVLRNNQILLLRSHRTLRAHDLNRRHCTDLRLALGIVQRSLSIRQGLLLHAHVFERVDEIPVHVFDLIDRGDYLQPEGNIGNLAIVFRDANESGIGQKSETLQQVLREAELKIRGQLGSNETGGVIGGQVSIVKKSAEDAAPLESLNIAEIRAVGVLRHQRHGAEWAGGLGLVLVELKSSRKLRVEACNRRPHSERGADQTVRTGPDAARGDGRAAGSRANGAAESAYAAAGSVLHHPGVYAENVRPRLGTQQVSFGDVQVVAREFEIEIVFQSQRDRIVDRQIDLAVAHKGINSRRVGEIRLGQFLRTVGPQHIRKRGLWLRIVLEMNVLKSRGLCRRSRLRRRSRNALLRLGQGGDHGDRERDSKRPGEHAGKTSQTRKEHELLLAGKIMPVQFLV